MVEDTCSKVGIGAQQDSGLCCSTNRGRGSVGVEECRMGLGGKVGGKGVGGN